MPFPIAETISTLGGLLGGGLNFLGSQYNSDEMIRASRENTDKTIAANKSMAEYAYSKDLDMWNRQNMYNNPAEQMARLKSAGLNPNLAYGSGSVAGNTSGAMPKYNPPTQQFNYAPGQRDVSGSIAVYQQIRQQEATVNQTQAQTEAIKQSTANAILDGIIKAVEASNAPTKTGQENTQREITNKQASETLAQYLRMAPYQLQVIQEQVAQQQAESKRKLGELKIQEESLIGEKESNKYKKYVSSLAEKGLNTTDPLFLRSSSTFIDDLGIPKEKYNELIKWLRSQLK